MFTQLTGLKKRQVFTLILFSNLTACSWLFPASFSKSQAPNAAETLTTAPETTEVKPEITEAKSNDQILKDSYNSSRAQKVMEVQKVFVDRHYQRVIRRDCDNNIKTDQQETVKSPTFALNLKAPNYSKFKSVFVYNDKTGDNRLTEMPKRDLPLLGQLDNVTSSGRWGIKIKADIAPAWLTFHVEPGLNNIFVEYHYDCAPRKIVGATDYTSIAKGCDESNDKILVDYPIDVDYRELRLSGILEIKPDPKTCPQK